METFWCLKPSFHRPSAFSLSFNRRVVQKHVKTSERDEPIPKLRDKFDFEDFPGVIGNAILSMPDVVTFIGFLIAAGAMLVAIL